MTFLYAYNRVLRLFGHDPATWTGDAAHQEEVAEALAYRARQAWEKTMWSRLVRTESFAVTTDGDGARYVPYGSGVDELAAVWSAHPRNPLVSVNPGRIGFWLSPRGVELGKESVDPVFIRYRPRPLAFTRVAYNGATTYAADAVVYASSTGDCYRSIAGGNTGQAVTDATKWERQTLPAWMMEAVILGAHADLLRNDGRSDRADVEDARAAIELDRVLLVEEAQQDQHRKINANR
jgi:hypothetical protein